MVNSHIHLDFDNVNHHQVQRLGLLFLRLEKTIGIVLLHAVIQTKIVILHWDSSMVCERSSND